MTSNEIVKKVVEDFKKKFVTRSAFGVSIGAIDSFAGTAEDQVDEWLTTTLLAALEDRDREVVEAIRKMKLLEVATNPGHLLWKQRINARLESAISIITSKTK